MDNVAEIKRRLAAKESVIWIMAEFGWNAVVKATHTSKHDRRKAKRIARMRELFRDDEE